MDFEIDMLSVAQICNTKLIGKNRTIKQIITDSRTIFSSENVVFCAIKGITFDGHKYIKELIKKGVTAFIVENDTFIKEYDVSYIVVNDTIKSLQKIASVYRKKFKGEVTAIIGSNGKSMVKEWISQLVTIEKSPKSYNSQLGVALSVLRTHDDSDYYLFEAGISQCGEMEILEQILTPSSVIFTTLTDAHSENFSSKELKLTEKMIMAKNCHTIIYNTDNEFTKNYIETHFYDKNLFSWGETNKSRLKVKSSLKQGKGLLINFDFEDENYSLKIPFSDIISYKNVMTSLAYIAATHPKHFLNAAIKKAEYLEPVEMRLEIKRGNGGAIIINDAYNSDLTSLSIALDALNSNCDNREKIIILSDIYQSHLKTGELYQKVASLLSEKGINTIYGIGRDICSIQHLFDTKNKAFFLTTKEFLDSIDENEFNGKAILLKGSRKFEFEKISATIEQQVHTTVLEVNLTTLLSNYLYLKSLLKPHTRCMAMVKADAYGCGAVEVAKVLEKQGVDYLAVAYADEGVKLREASIKLPIVVLNSEPHAYKTMIKYGLEPEIYSFKSLKEFSSEVKHSLGVDYPIHLKMDTGMHRLGFIESELDTLISLLKENRWVKVTSIFSHFTSSDNPSHDIYSKAQIDLYERMSSKIKNELGLKNVIRHLANSFGIERFKDAEYDMVRMGISLYAASDSVGHIKNIVSLKSVIAQIHIVDDNETVGYNKRQTLTKKSRIATVPIGYADGLRRALSCGVWSVEVAGKLAPIVGNICMDASMIDVSDIDCNEGDEVIIIGKNNSVNSMAEHLNTITYEVMTLLSPRVKRVYIKE